MTALEPDLAAGMVTLSQARRMRDLDWAGHLFAQGRFEEAMALIEETADRPVLIVGPDVAMDRFELDVLGWGRDGGELILITTGAERAALDAPPQVVFKYIDEVIDYVPGITLDEGGSARRMNRKARRRADAKARRSRRLG